jgi:hypothetical protein
MWATTSVSAVALYTAATFLIRRTYLLGDRHVGRLARNCADAGDLMPADDLTGRRRGWLLLAMMPFRRCNSASIELLA